MADLKAQIELAADASGVEAGVSKAKRSINSLGVATASANSSAAKSIDRYIKKLEQQQKMAGMSAREMELYKLAMRGASDEQLKAAESAIKLREAYEKGEASGDRLRSGFISIAAASVAVASGMLVATNSIIEQIANYQGLSEKIGDTASSIAALQSVSDLSGVSLDSVAEASVRLTASLSKTDDESKSVGAAISALGLDFKQFKALSPVQQLDAVAQAMGRFADGSEKTAVAVALFGKSGADMIPFFNDLADASERQIRLTDEQIAAADEYSKAQARLTSELRSFLQLAAADAVPGLTAMQSVISDLAQDEATMATATAVLEGAMKAVTVAFQTIAVVGSEVGFVFLGVGREMGAIAAQINALARLDFSGFSAISDAVREDGVRARAELDKFQAKIMGIGQPVIPADSSNYSNEGRNSGTPGRPTLSTAGLAGSGAANDAAQLAKAKLAYDIEQIRKASDGIANAYSNAEKIMEARRAANLIDEREYYAAKLGFLNLNAAEQERALTKEITRLESEKLAGKDKLENDRKIVDAQQKLAKVRADLAAGIEINSVQEVAANTKIAQSYADARAAAEAYIETIRRQNTREIESIGRGAKFREQQAGRNAIEDKFTGQRQVLERDKRNGLITQDEFDTYLRIAEDTYAQELRMFDERNAGIDEKLGEWTAGASEALQNYLDQTENIAGQTESLISEAFHGMEDALVQFVKTGKLDFKSLADFMISEIIRIQVRSMIASASGGSGGWLTTLIGAAFGAMGRGAGPSSTVNGVSWTSGYDVPSQRAIGGPVSAGGLYEVNEKGRPEMLSVAGKQYLMMGNQSGSVSPGGSSPMNLTIVNQTSAPIGKVTERQISPTERALIIEEAVDTVAAAFDNPNSRPSKAVSRNFNSPRSRS